MSTKAYREAHREELNAKQKIYAANNKIAIAATSKIYREKTKEVQKAYRAKYGPVYRAKNKEALAEKNSQYIRTPKGQEINRAKQNRRRAAIVLRTPVWTTELDLFMIEEIYHLSSLRTLLTGIEWQVDHILPLQGEKISGLHTPSNMQVITAREHRAKGLKWEGM
jgi:hypothetical protein